MQPHNWREYTKFMEIIYSLKLDGINVFCKSLCIWLLTPNVRQLESKTNANSDILMEPEITFVV